jgi:methionine biosynthesis protein MetW
MSDQRDKVHFEKVWQSKIDASQIADKYKRGNNLRVDKVLDVVSPGTRFLDLGCGAGILASQLTGKFREIYGVDISETAVRIAQKNGVLAQVCNLNAELLPYEDNFFDTVTILATLQLIYDLNFVLQECFRVLKPKGVIYISVPNMRTFWRLYKLAILGIFPRTSLDPVGLDGGTLHYFCFRNLVELLNKNGFETIDKYGIFCLPGFIRKLPDRGVLGSIKREFFSAEILVKSTKMPYGNKS